MQGQYYFYIPASNRNGTLYIGVTNDLLSRVYEHKSNIVEGFTRKYDVHKLVYYQAADDAESVIIGEKQLKKWKGKRKVRLIEEINPELTDLYQVLL